MDRRLFLTGVLGVAGVAATWGLSTSRAEATVLDQLKSLDPPPPASTEPDIAGSAPDGTGIETVRHRRWHRRRYLRRRHVRRWRRRRYYRRAYYWRRPRRFCRTYWNYWGAYRRCWWG